MSQKTNSPSPLLIIYWISSIVFLSFILGTLFYEFKIWPYGSLRKAYAAARAWKEKLEPVDRYQTGFFGPSPRQGSGVLEFNQQKAYKGYTVFTSSHEQKAFLLSMEGQIVHEWEIPFSKVWSSSPPHIKVPNSDDFVVLAKAHIYPNGDLLVIHQSMNDTPYGYGLARVDKNSQVIWKYPYYVHHDVTVGNDGKIYTLTQELVRDNIDWYDDFIIVLSPDGKELKKLSVAKAFRNSEYSGTIENIRNWDPLHTNAVEVLNENIADKFPLFKKGQVLISPRNLNAIAVVDLEEEKVVWATTGAWRQQHDPDFLPNGNILLFDNKGHIGEGGKSRVMEINPKTMEISWQYTGDQDNIFDSPFGSSQQRLPNGNTLITQTQFGRIFEVTSDQKIVWEFMSPFRSPNDEQIVGTVYQAQRFKPEFFKFKFNLVNE
ncbi:arylsulfotransferase family protein [Okeania sp. SIO2B3]|uniref:arylsulfotransferase family protein n=1 Tax=Okeania sp. SIO2B3 TaxID=2607784 RepID=UPI0013C1CFA6|nr:arylsulfotransferase family protein [Okeania sp. SIO2B3]NET42219.1 hypothetical protein [Okeania sp. SIO2B3]